jgi:hypothetical protein
MVPDVPELEIISDDTSLQVKPSKSGMLYIVPPGTERQIDSIEAGQLKMINVLMDTPVELSAAGLSTGDYLLYLVDDCRNISEGESVTIITGVENNFINSIMIYPNPAHDRISIETNGSTIMLSIQSIRGQVIHCSIIDKPIQEIDLSDFQKGVYIITIRSRDLVWTEKIIKL